MFPQTRPRRCGRRRPRARVSRGGVDTNDVVQPICKHLTDLQPSLGDASGVGLGWKPRGQNCDGSRADNADRLLIRPASGRQAGTRRGPTPGYSVVSTRATRRAARACAREKMPGGGALARRAATRCRRHRGPRRCLRRSSRARTRASSRPDAGSAKSQRTSRRARSRSSRRCCARSSPSPTPTSMSRVAGSPTSSRHACPSPRRCSRRRRSRRILTPGW